MHKYNKYNLRVPVVFAMVYFETQHFMAIVILMMVLGLILLVNAFLSLVIFYHGLSHAYIYIHYITYNTIHYILFLVFLAIKLSQIYVY